MDKLPAIGPALPNLLCYSVEYLLSSDFSKCT